MKKKTVCISICILLIIAILPTSGTIVEKSSILSFGGNTLYVGGNGTGNYTKIQDAIDESSNGDTVFVYDDSSPYYETLMVDKSIQLIGEDREATTIDGNESGDVVSISTDWVNISGFTIQNSGNNGIYISSNYNTIIGNIVTSNNLGGIRLDFCDNNTITGNNVSNNDYGIVFSYSDDNTITENNVSNNEYGIALYETSDSNIITGNNIHNNGFGVHLYIGCFYNIITGNSISNSNYGIMLHTSHENTIRCNNIQNNDVRGLELGASNKNIIEKNNFIGNKRHTLFGFSGRNTWDENYWDNWIGLKINWTIFQKFPKIIFGFIGINFDWHPAKEPYDIGV